MIQDLIMTTMKIHLLRNHPEVNSVLWHCWHWLIKISHLYSPKVFFPQEDLLGPSLAQRDHGKISRDQRWRDDGTHNIRVVTVLTDEKRAAWGSSYGQKW